jgi:hypothetical protein
MEGWRQRRLGSKEDHSTTKGNYKTDLTLTGLLMEGLVRRFNRKGDLEKILPDEIRGSTLWPGNELVLPHAEASSAVGIAIEHQIAILGFEAFEVRKDGLLTVDLNDPSAHISFAGDLLAYVVAMNTEAAHWIKEHRYGANHGYILTSASKSEFDQIQKLRKTL